MLSMNESTDPTLLHLLSDYHAGFCMHRLFRRRKVSAGLYAYPACFVSKVSSFKRRGRVVVSRGI